MTTTDVIRKLIGSIQPTGDASRDPERLQNYPCSQYSTGH